MKLRPKSIFFKKLVSSYLLILLIPILIFCTILFFQVKNNKQESQINEFHKEAENVIKLVDKCFGNIDTVNYNLRNSSWLQKAYSDSKTIKQYFDSATKADIFNQMTIYDSISETTKGLTILLPEKETVINSIGWYNLYTYFRGKGILKSEDQQKILKEVMNTEYFKLVRLKDIGISSAKERDFVMIQNLDNPNNRGYLYAPFNIDALDRYIKAYASSDLFDFSIYVGNQLIYSFENADRQRTSENIYAYESSSPIYPIEYKISFDSNSFQLNLNDLSIVMVALVLTTMAGFFFSYLLAMLTYKPIKKLMLKINVNNGVPKDTEFEFTTIERVLNDLTKEKNLLSQQVLVYYDTVRNNILFNLIQGYFISGEVKKNFSTYNISFAENQFYCAAIFNVNLENDQEQDDRKLSIYLHIKSYLMLKEISFEMMQLEDLKYVILFNCDNVFNHNYIQEVLNSISISLAERLNVAININIGTIEKGYLGISKSYQNAKEESITKYLKNLDKDESCELNNINYYFPTDWQIQLINYLKLGNASLAVKIIDELNRENSKRHLPQHLRVRVTFLIMQTLIRVIEELNLELIDAIDVFEQDITQYTDKKQWEYIKNIAVMICNRTRENERSKTTSIGNRMIAYLEDNYNNPGLSLQDLSDAFQMSVSSASRFFKQTVKINFCDFLCRIRMEKAKEYFKSGDQTIAEVAKLVGYDNDVSFRRAFLRYEGVTPGDYIKKYASTNKCVEIIS